MQRKTLNVLFLIFTLSGFSGLIYESIWTHYLKLFLGHAAYAQTLVLAIFMGGMAIGSWICGAWSLRWRNLLLGYAVVEGAIGLMAIGFHTVFDGIVRYAYVSVLPQLGSPALAGAFKWTVSALLIMPQSLLLGMTFPLMSAGILRLSPREPGRTISLLYFTNSLGAAIGVLTSGFVLIRLIGLPGTIRIAGLINIALACAVVLVMRQQGAQGRADDAPRDPAEAAPRRGRTALFLAASLITGAASFIYEIGWIRMLNLVLGTSTHAFELMLSAFILGLALGGLWIQRRIDRIASPGRFLSFVQVIMGMLALSTLVLYGQTFSVMQWIVKTLNKTDGGYALFNLSSNAIALVIMLPTTFCAGMTLPLITYQLLKQGRGEGSIGEVYAANTVGAIIGVFFAIHVGLPLLGLKGLLVVGAGLDIGLGVVLAWRFANAASRLVPAAVTALSLGAIAASLLFVGLDPYQMASGVYRDGHLHSSRNVDIKFHADGKTATISLLFMKGSGELALATNGKTDAALNPDGAGRATSDEPTMILMGVLPMALHPQARTAAAIGLGSGLTTQTLLSNPRLQQVDTVEIERRVVEASRMIGPRVGAVFNDRRSRIFIDDAKTYFSLHNAAYDIIVSEPSNPWVSGVASLFSEEFYRLITRYLSDDGVFVQWIQLYEIDADLIISVLKAVDANFADYAVYATNDFDALIIARKKGRMPALDPEFLAQPAVSAALGRIRVSNVQDIEIRKLGDKGFLHRLLDASPIRANSDYYPVLDQNAARARFLKADAYAFHTLTSAMLPAYELLTGNAPSWKTTDVTLSPYLTKSEFAFTAMALRDYNLQGHFGPRYGAVPSGVERQARTLRQSFSECLSGPDQTRHTNLFNVSVEMVPYLRPQELNAVWTRLETGACRRARWAEDQHWIALFKAVGRRDGGGMANEAEAILATGGSFDPLEERMLVASAMVGSLMQGDRPVAFGYWKKYRTALFRAGEPDLFFRLLAAESTRPD